MVERAVPPEDISPEEFFTRWIPEMVASDDERRRRLGETQATIVFSFTDAQQAAYTLFVAGGSVRGEAVAHADPDLQVSIDVPTWRSLNRGELSAPEAALKRRVKLKGNLILALKLHLILG
jgi:putative sterol carrier protein